ncbi:hypothetical protein QBC43DRAFT_202547 [Cladorrhinum sp. PSN259]|nr:hypothetical protein QBC43DRAFT_202547 [Cladorrhinum sp. PSN259]
MGTRDTTPKPRDAHRTEPAEQKTESICDSSSEVVPPLSPCVTASSGASDTLDQERRQLVESLMTEFQALFDKHSGLRERPAESRSSRSSPQQQGQSSPGQGVSQDRSWAGDYFPRDVNNGSDGSEGPAENQQEDLGSLDSTSARKLSCPYYQRDPRKALKNRSCAGPGWPSIHRVKEHLNRVHALPIFCQRCGDAFKTDPELTAHTRLAQACEVRSFDIPDGFTREQEKLLKRKSKPNSSNEEKWKEIYRILFPEDDESDIPSPSDQLEDYPTDDAETREQEFDNYERHLKRELPQVVRRRLEQAARELELPRLNDLSAQLVDIVRSSQSEVFRQYRTLGQQRALGDGMQSGLTGMAVDAPPSNPGMSEPPLQQDLYFQPNLESGMSLDFVDHFAAFYPQTPVDENATCLPQPPEMFLPTVTWQIPVGSRPAIAHSDSGYGSNDASVHGSGKQWMDLSPEFQDMPYWAQP